MRKKLVGIFACLCLSVTLSGCGGGDKAESSSLVSLGDYKNLEIEIDKSYEITEESERATIENYFLSAPIYEENKEKTTIEYGDVANIDYTGTKDGVEFDGGSAQGYNLEIGSGTFIDGFESGLVGKKVGEEVDLNLTFPEDYGNEDLAGKEVVFHVKVNSIQNKSYPTYDTMTDEYVADNYGAYFGVSTVEELKAYVEKTMQENLDTALSEAMTAKLKEVCEVGDIPDDLRQERKEELKEYYHALAKQQDQEFADFLQNNYGMSEDDFNEKIDSLMTDYIISDLIWEAVAEKEGIKAEGSDYDKFLSDLMQNLSYEKQEDFFGVYPETMVKRMYLAQKAKEKVEETAKIEYVEGLAEQQASEESSDDAQDETQDATGDDATGDAADEGAVDDTIDTTIEK